ncbi:MAG: acyltransferase family protein [Pseudomonadota bacterium]
MKMKKIDYRADIDGLRAIAVIAVLLYHLDFDWIPGGYLGVDIFFVVSGFIITKIALHQLSIDGFSIKEFWVRRVLRIFPALYVVLFVSTLISFFIFTYDDYLQYTKSLIAAVFFLPNIFYMRKVESYFSDSSQNEVLLHTWSLGVEEQFYIAFPILFCLLSLCSWKKLFPTAVAALTVISFVWCFYLDGADPKQAFYAPWARAWEFGFGVLINFIPSVKTKKMEVVKYSRWAAFFVIGVCMIPLFNLEHLGASAALPLVLATSIIIWVGPCGGTVITQLLEQRQVRYIGKISYSLYLWHWPIIVFYSYPFPEKVSLGVVEQVSLAGFTVLVAVLSHRLIEQRFRVYSGEARFRSLSTVGVSGALLAFAGGVILFNPSTSPQSGPSPLGYITAKQEASEFQKDPCLVRGQSLPDDSACGIEDPLSSEKNYDARIMLWGDSHAAHLIDAVRVELSGKNVKLSFATKAGCPPIIDVRFVPSDFLKKECPDFNKNVIDYIQDRPPDVLIVAGSWHSTIESKHTLVSDTDTDNIRNLSNSLAKMVTISNDLGIKTIFVGPVPEPSFDPVRCVEIKAHHKKSLFPCIVELSHRNLTVEEEFSKVVSPLVSDNILYLPLMQEYCGEEVCRYATDEELLFIDDSHISGVEARRILGLISSSILGEGY